MSFLKFRANQIFTGKAMLSSNEVLITSPTGVVVDMVAATEAGDDVQQLQGMLLPGFINAHCHLELSHLKNKIARHTGLLNFVFEVVSKRHFPAAEIALAMQQAEKEMLANGIVAVGDICNNTSSFLQKQQAAIAYHNFIEVSGWQPEVAAERFKKSKDIFDTFSSNTTAATSFAPHAPYSVSEALWQLIHPFFSNHITTIHNQETQVENIFFETGKGDMFRMYQQMNLETNFFSAPHCSSLQYHLPKLQSAKNVLLVHNTFSSEADILFAENKGKKLAEAGAPNLFWCICINANQYIENALPPLALLRKNNCNIVLGTDSLASNNSLSILDEMKTIHQFFPQIPLAEMLCWACNNGAIALGMDDKLGCFNNGKQPGVLLMQGLENGLVSKHTFIKRLV